VVEKQTCIEVIRKVYFKFQAGFLHRKKFHFSACFLVLILPSGFSFPLL